jgi:hypothetical protein
LAIQTNTKNPLRKRVQVTHLINCMMSLERFCTSHTSVVPTITPYASQYFDPANQAQTQTQPPQAQSAPLPLPSYPYLKLKSIAMSRSVPTSRQLSPDVRDRNVNGNGNKLGSGSKLLNNSSGYISASGHTNGYTSSRARTPVAEFVDPAEHPALNPGCVAVITGAASGIGLAAAVQLAGCV